MSRSAPTKCVIRPSASLQRDHRARGREGRTVPPLAQQRAAPHAPFADLRADVSRECAGPAVDEVGKPEAGELAPRVTEGADERIVRELEPAVGTRDQDQIAVCSVAAASSRMRASVRCSSPPWRSETKCQHAKAGNGHQSGEQRRGTNPRRRRAAG